MLGRLSPRRAGDDLGRGPLSAEPVGALDAEAIDTLIVPGALHVDGVTRDGELIAWVRRRAPDCRRVRSVRAGTFLLATAGLPEGRRAG